MLRPCRPNPGIHRGGCIQRARLWRPHRSRAGEPFRPAADQMAAPGGWYCSCRTPDDANRREGQPIDAESTQHFRIERGVTREPPVEIVRDLRMVTRNLIQEFEPDARRAEPTNHLNLAPTA